MSTRSAADLLLVVGPIASGKSSTAAGVAAQLRERGHLVALVGLDEVADSVARADWAAAHQVLGELTGAWLRQGATVVCEGPSTPDQVAEVTRWAPEGTRVVTVRLAIDLAAAHARAQTDPSRGISKDLAFLTRDHADHDAGVAGLAVDLVIDSGTTTLDEAVSQIVAVLNGD
ncbi:hypothetical protein [Aestuariimicrobium ganziense]|uniref:hypothetical protein n=1 Tax=Aestuariimicrobium ganziense TaxID=2773677 RepID=UPI001944CCF6|nr:hypothetical protein [Aestuariimicrobium ganziense]